MKIKVLRAQVDLSQKAFAERLGLTAQTIQKYESGSRNIPDSIEKLIRYEFAEYLTNGEGLTSKKNGNSKVENGETENFKVENETLKKRVKELEQDKADLKRDKEMLQLYIESLTGKSSDNQQTA